MATDLPETSFRKKALDKFVQTSASIKQSASNLSSSIKERIHKQAEERKPNLTGAERIAAISRLGQNLKLSTISPAGTPQYSNGFNSQMAERLFHILHEKTDANVTLDEERIDFIRLLAKNYERTVIAEKYKLLARNTTLGYRTHIKDRINEIIRNLQNYEVENVAEMLTQVPTSLSVEIVAEILDLNVQAPPIGSERLNLNSNSNSREKRTRKQAERLRKNL